MARKGPIATDVKPDGLGGYMCAKALCNIYVVKIEIGPRIGTRITWRHVDLHPPCEYMDVRVL